MNVIPIAGEGGDAQEAIQGQLAHTSEVAGKHSPKPCLVTVVKVPVPYNAVTSRWSPTSAKEHGSSAIYTRLDGMHTQRTPQINALEDPRAEFDPLFVGVGKGWLATTNPLKSLRRAWKPRSHDSIWSRRQRADAANMVDLTTDASIQSLPQRGRLGGGDQIRTGDSSFYLPHPNLPPRGEGARSIGLVPHAKAPGLGETKKGRR